MRVKQNYYPHKTVKLDHYVEEWVDNTCGDHYGIAEGAARTATNTLEAFGRLINVLADKGLLNNVEVSMIVHGYRRDIELVKEESHD
jgi:hypothetical protein